MSRIAHLWVLLALIVAAPALAENIFAPPWALPPTDPAYRPDWVGGVTTSQTWQFEGAAPGVPTISENPFGMAGLTVLGGDIVTEFYNGQTGLWEPVRGPLGNPTGAIYVPPGTGGTIDITIPNSPVPNLLKVIFLQITSDKGIDGSGITSDPPGSQVVPSGYGPRGWDVPPNTPAPSGCGGTRTPSCIRSRAILPTRRCTSPCRPTHGSRRSWCRRLACLSLRPCACWHWAR